MKLYPIFAALAILTIQGCGVPAKTTDTGGSSGSSNLTTTFGARCAGCHGSAGGGGSARSLKTSTLSLSEWTTVVRDGRSGTNMRSYPDSQYANADLEKDYKAITGK